MGLMRARSLKLNKGVKPLAQSHTAPTFGPAQAASFGANLEARLLLLRGAVAQNDKLGAQIYAANLDQTARRVGAWCYRGRSAAAAELWCGADGWAARLLKLELELAALENEAARTAHTALRPLIGAICQMEQVTQEH